MAERSGASLVRLYQIHRRQDRRRRVHERADLAAMGGAPVGYDAAAYGRDFKAFLAFIKTSEPDAIVLGPGSVGETAVPVSSTHPAPIHQHAGPAAGVRAGRRRFFLSSLRRGLATVLRSGPNHTGGRAFGRVAGEHGPTLAFYRTLRDEFAPGKPMWLTETAEAACGGNPWASTFLDTFRYLDQLGRLAKAGVQMVAHNTLAASDYGLLDEKTLRRGPTIGGRCFGAG